MFRNGVAAKTQLDRIRETLEIHELTRELLVTTVRRIYVFEDKRLVKNNLFQLFFPDAVPAAPQRPVFRLADVKNLFPAFIVVHSPDHRCPAIPAGQNAAEQAGTIGILRLSSVKEGLIDRKEFDELYRLYERKCEGLETSIDAPYLLAVLAIYITSCIADFS